ncbi:MAG TPA: S8 family serine peptidase [Thermoanaerobaculia bacterium]|nr:S8 family serine peptidase [Thermoanaerobaculia bacterium]
MKKTLAILISLGFAVPLFAQSKSRYLVSTTRRPAISSLRMLRDPQELASHTVRTYANLDLFAADLTADEVAALKKSADVDYVSPVAPRYVDGTFRTPLRFDTNGLHTASTGHHQEVQTVWYGIDLVNARALWNYTRGNAGGVNVAVIDTGIDYNHPELKDRYQGGYNTFTKTNDPKDDHGHGTHVSGIIAAADNNFGVVGVAPEVKLWVTKVLKADGSGTDETVIAGLDWVISKKREIGGNWVVNLSLGADGGSEPERQAFAQAIDEGILIVAAAGNTGADNIQYPGAYDQVLAISAIDSKSQLASFSTYGGGVAFASPGVDVLSSVPVGTGRDLEIAAGNQALDAWNVQGAKDGTVTGQTVFQNYCSATDVTAAVKGKIAVCRRGKPSTSSPDITFSEKAMNAINNGAIGVVIVPNDDRTDNSQWTLLLKCAGCPPDPDLASFNWGVVLSVAKADGDALVASAGQQITLTNAPDDYAVMSGTSMATPHVVGVAALVWSLAPQMTAAQMRLALKLSSDDLGTPGHDVKFGYGRIDALSSAKYVAPSLFGLPATQPPVPTRRRPSDHH